MLNRISKSVICILLLLFSFFIVGCEQKKKLISFDHEMIPFSFMGIAKPAPFSESPNFWGYFKHDTKSFKSELIKNFLIFRNPSGDICIIYKNFDLEFVMLSQDQDRIKQTVISVDEIKAVQGKAPMIENLSFNILQKEIILQHIRCVLVLWDSREILIRSYGDILDGLKGASDYNIKGKEDPLNSGDILFTDWHKNDHSWPRIKEFHFPMIESD